METSGGDFKYLAEGSGGTEKLATVGASNIVVDLKCQLFIGLTYLAKMFCPRKFLDIVTEAIRQEHLIRSHGMD